MFKTHKILALVISLLVAALMTVPAFAQARTPAPPTATPTPANEGAGLSAAPTSATPSDDNTPGSINGHGLFGNVTAVGDASITVSTNQGDVTVATDSHTKIRKAPDGAVTLADIAVGDRVAVLMDGAPVSNGAATPPFSGVTALSIFVIPSQPVHTHQHAVVTTACSDSGNGTMTVVTPSGKQLTLTCNGNTTPDGTDTILLAQQQGQGKPDTVQGSMSPDQIRQRLQDFKAAATSARAAVLDMLQTRQEAMITQRLQNVESMVPDAVKAKIQTAMTRIQNAFGQHGTTPSGTQTPGSPGSNGQQPGATRTPVSGAPSATVTPGGPNGNGQSQPEVTRTPAAEGAS